MDSGQSDAKRLNTKRTGPTRLLPGLAGEGLIFQWIGLTEYISAPEMHWCLLPDRRLASRNIHTPIIF
jgi:hypothetical protein